MAKKGTYSYIDASVELRKGEKLNDSREFPYLLLKAFCGYGDSSIARVRDGRGNAAKDENFIIIKGLFAFQYLDDMFGEDSVSEALDTLKSNPAVLKHRPRLFIVGCGKQIMAYDPREEDHYDNTVDLIWKDFEFFKPLAGIEKFHSEEESEADVRSAEMMAKLYDDISRYNDMSDVDVARYVNVFMSRLLFCFFAEDTGLFEQNQFTKAITENTKSDGSDLAEFLDQLFVIMSTNDKVIRERQTNKVISAFPYVNGGLFLQRHPIPVLSKRCRQLMLRCGGYNWGEINPDIFGSMTQAIVSPEARSELGMHYTSVPNILKVIQPLFLESLWEEFYRSKNSVKALNALLLRMSRIKFFDPACGSGNFLIITYKRLRELEIAIWKQMQELGEPRLPWSNISLTQFYGIEIDEYARDTAVLSLWLAEHQMNRIFANAFEVSPDALPLKPSGNIVCGNACRLDWDKVCPHTPEEEVYVFGNPPYLGSRNQDFEQKIDLDKAVSVLHNYRKLDYISSI